ncbi:MAG: hypothetical protein CMJ64_26785 [Planctomycetaceae bacterium]|nr:hypothetical protein [Planctomycetaceae bacterium]
MKYLLAFILWTVTLSSLVRAEEPIQLGSRRELMLDDFLFSEVDGLEFRQHSPREAEKVLNFDANWEGRPYHGISACGYPVVIADGDLFRLYYTSYHGLRLKPVDADRQFTCYCESRDGIDWRRVELGRVEFEESTRNNILLQGGTSHNFAPFIDTRPGVPADERYKAVAGNGKAFVFASADGLTWRKLREEPILDGEEEAFDKFGAIRWGFNSGKERAILDSLNVAFWDSQREQYVLFFRAYLPCLSRDGKKQLPETRSVMRCTSKDFRHWENIEPIEFGEPRREWIHSLYTSGLKPYFRAPHLYLGFPLRTSPRRPFHGGSFGMSESGFMFSRDAKTFTLMKEPFLRPGRDPKNWTKHGNMMGWGMLQTADDELSFYYLQHDHQADSFLRRGVLRVDGFVSLHAAEYPGGVAITKPLVFEGDRLEINAATGSGGGIRVGFLDAETLEPIEGFGESNEFYGDQIQHFLHFGKRRDISSLAGKSIRLKISMYGADLYSLKFSTE